MLNTALIGVGAMGRGHLENLIRHTKEGKLIKLVAICDVRPEKLKDEKIDFNLDVGGSKMDYSKFNSYTDMDEMLAKEKIDLVLVVLPTYLHCEITVKCLKLGKHVFCEKPMALNAVECEKMINTAKECGKQLMIGQCLRFWGQYEALKKIVDEQTFGKPLGGYFFRGGGTPLWSFENWLLRRECGGGALVDQHVHDIDMINYLFGMPKAVQTVAYKLYPDSAYDTVSTNYIYDSGIAINAQDDWALVGTAFGHQYRVNFEKGTVIMNRNEFVACSRNGEPYTPEFDNESAYYKELVYFATCILEGKENTINPPTDSMNTIKIMEAETKSADNKSIVVDVI